MKTNPYEHRYADTCGFRTHYIEAGDAAGTDVVILIHGGGPGADGWGNWFDCLPVFAHKHRTIAIDLAGYGGSEAPAGYVYSQAARNEQLVAFIEALKVGPVSVVGNSMGGATALGAAMARPELVKNLVLMGSAGLNFNVGKVGEAVKPLAQFDFTLDGMKRIVGALASPGFVPAEGMPEYRFELASRPERKASFGGINQWIIAQKGLHYDEAEIAKVKTRTLVVGGKNDKVVTLANNYRFLELLDNSYGFVIPHCGHWAMLEQTKLFTDVSLHFLAGYMEPSSSVRSLPAEGAQASLGAARREA